MANSIYEMFTAGVDRGQQRKERRTLSDYLQPALAGDQQAQAAIYGANPDTGMKVEGLAQQRAQGAEKSRAERMARSGKLAAAYASNPNPLLWRQFKAEVSDIPELAQMPEDLSDPNDAKGAAELARAWAAAYGTPAEDGTPSAIRELQMLQANPELAKLDMQRRQAGWRPQLFTTDQGFAAYDPRTNGVSPLNYGQPQPSNMQYQTEDGQPVPPEDMAAFTAAATQGGTFAVGPGGKSIPVSQPAMGAFGAPERVKPPTKAGDKPSDLERRVEMARGMGATDEEVRRMVVGGDSSRDAQRISTADATKARQKMTQIQSARQQLQAAKAAFGKLRNTYSAGPGGGYLPTPEGQAFDRAIRNLSPLITAVTRVPGVGAMSDFESKLQEASLPSRGTYEEVTLQQIADLERLLDTIEGGYTDLLGGNSETSPGPAPRAADRRPSNATPKRLKFNPATGRIE